MNYKKDWDINDLKDFLSDCTGEFEFFFNNKNIVIDHHGRNYYDVYTDEEKFYVDSFKGLCSLKLIDNKSINDLNRIKFIR